MKKAITILLAFVLGAQMLSAQYYYRNKGLEYLDIGWKDSAFLTFKQGMDHGELASVYYVIYCYISEIGTPRDCPKAEALMAKYYTKSPDICILAANYFAGFITKWDYNSVAYWREYCCGKKSDPALALKYAHYYLDHWDYAIGSEYLRSGSFDAFHVLMDYEIAGKLHGKYGFKKDPEAAMNLYLKWVGKNSISGHDAMYYGLNWGGDNSGWFICLLRQCVYYSDNTQDFLNKCNLLRKKGILEKLYNYPLADWYPGPRPYRWVKQENIKHFYDYINGCENETQISELRSIFSELNLLKEFEDLDSNSRSTLDQALTRQTRRLGDIENAANKKKAETWFLEHLNDSPEVQSASYNAQPAKVQSIISGLYSDYVKNKVAYSDSEEELLSLKNNLLTTDRLSGYIDSAVIALRNKKWSQDQFVVLMQSESISDLTEFINDPRTTTYFKEEAKSLLADVKKEKKNDRDKAINDIINAYITSDHTVEVVADDFVIGSPNYEKYRDSFKELRINLDRITNSIKEINDRYPYLDANNRLETIKNNYSEKLTFADLLIKEDDGKANVSDYAFLSERLPLLYQAYLQDAYAIARADQLTKDSTGKEIKAVKQLPMSAGAKERVEQLTKRSYLSKKQ